MKNEIKKNQKKIKNKNQILIFIFISWYQSQSNPGKKKKLTTTTNMSRCWYSRCRRCSSCHRSLLHWFSCFFSSLIQRSVRLFLTFFDILNSICLLVYIHLPTGFPNFNWFICPKINCII